MLEVGQQYLKNVSWSWAAYAARLAITFFFVPYITYVLGGPRYGVWVILFQIISYFSLLDLGLTSAITRYVSKHLARRDYGAINRVLNSSTVIYLAAGIAAMLGVFLFTQFFFDFFRIGDPATLEEGKTALLVLGAFVAFNFWLLPFGNSLPAFHRQDIASLLRLGEETIRAALWALALYLGEGLVTLAFVALGLTVARHFVSAFLLRKLHPEIAINFGLTDRATIGALIRYSRVSLGIAAGWLVIHNTDSVLLGLLTSSAAAGLYQPAAQLLLHARNLVNAAAAPLIPAISHIDASSPQKRVRDLYLRGVKYVSFLSFFIATAIVIYARPFVDLWLPAEFHDTSQVMAILAIGSAVYIPQIIGNSILFGIGKHKYILWVLVIESTAKIGLALSQLPDLTMTDMAIACAAPQVVLYLTLSPYLMGRALTISPLIIIGTVLRNGLLAAFVTYCPALLMQGLLTPNSWFALTANALVVAAVAAPVGWAILECKDRDRLRSLLRRS